MRPRGCRDAASRELPQLHKEHDARERKDEARLGAQRGEERVRPERVVQEGGPALRRAQDIRARQAVQLLAPLARSVRFGADWEAGEQELTLGPLRGSARERLRDFWHGGRAGGKLFCS